MARKSKTTRHDKLTLSSGASRLRNLENKRKRLTKSIERVRNKSTRCDQEQQQFARSLASQLAPVIERGILLDEEIHQLFAEIFQTRKFGKRSGKQVRDVYHSLQTSGVISNRMDSHGEEPLEWAEGDEPDDDWGEGEDAARPWTATAQQPKRQLRDLFLQLAGSFHPDLAGDEETRMRHTEVMKEVNRAYKAGDVVSLLAIEQDLAISAGQELSSADDDFQAVCARLETHIELLKQQLSDLKDRLKEQQNSELGLMLDELRRFRRSSQVDPAELFLDQAREELEEMEALRDFVHRFRHRKMTIKEFVRGPSASEEDELIDLLDEDMLEYLRVEIEQALGPHGPKRGRKRR